MAQGKSNTFHYAGIGIEDVDGTAVAPDVLQKYQDFKGNAKIETEVDEGHMGTRGKGTETTRVKAYAEPEITDRIRWDGGIEQMCKAFCGSAVSTRNIPTTGLSYTHVYDEADTLPTYTYTHGFNVGSETARTFAGCVCNTLEFNFPTEEAPTVTAGFISNFPVFGATEPTLTYTTTKAAQSGQLKVFWGDVGSTPSTPIPGLQEASVSLNNNFEATVAAGNTWGTVDKDMGDLTVEGNFTLKYYDTDYQREWATGTTSGTAVNTENLAKALRFQYEGPTIETSYKYDFTLDIKNAEITDVVPSEGGDGSKTFEFSFTGALDSSSDKFGLSITSKIPTLE